MHAWHHKEAESIQLNTSTECAVLTGKCKHTRASFGALGSYCSGLISPIISVSIDRRAAQATQKQRNSTSEHLFPFERGFVHDYKLRRLVQYLAEASNACSATSISTDGVGSRTSLESFH